MKYVKWVLSLTLLILVVFIWVLRKNNSFCTRETRFAIENIGTVDHIEIAGSEQVVNLLLENGNWKANESEARQDMVKLLLSISGDIQAEMPVPERDCDSARMLLKKNTKVTFFKGKKKLNYFTICSWKNKTIGLHGSSRQPFILSSSSLPNTNLTLIFNPSPVFWTSNLIIDLQPSQIYSVEIVYPQGGKKGYTVKRDEKGNPTIDEQAGINQSYNFQTIDEYLYFFTNIRFTIDKGISTPEQRSEILNSPLLFQLTITATTKQVKSLKAYPRKTANTGETDVFSFYGMSSDSILILLKYSDFDPILLDRDYFLKK